MIMKPRAPKVITFWISVILAVLGFLGHSGVIASFAAYDFWLVLAGFVLLALGVLLKGL
jgi:hypothetical protein